MAKVARTTGIPETTLFYWKNHSDWWDTLVVEVRGEKADEQRQGYSLIVDKAHKETLDRLKNGDFAHFKGEKFRIPVKAKDAAIISGIASEKIRLADNMPTSITANGNAEEQIKKLVQFFNDISSKYTENQANAIPGEYKKIEEDQDK